MKYLIIVTFLMLIASCTDPKGAKEVLENNGFKQVEITGYDLWGCSSDDLFHTSFTALTKKNNYVTGVVCSGWFKGSTIRFY